MKTLNQKKNITAYACSRFISKNTILDNIIFQNQNWCINLLILKYFNRDYWKRYMLKNDQLKKINIL